MPVSSESVMDRDLLAARRASSQRAGDSGVAPQAAERVCSKASQVAALQARHARAGPLAHSAGLRKLALRWMTSAGS